MLAYERMIDISEPLHLVMIRPLCRVRLRWTANWQGFSLPTVLAVSAYCGLLVFDSSCSKCTSRSEHATLFNSTNRTFSLSLLAPWF